ncbi:hypothetical protein T06_6259 [Trichinella sp. T6]|nr:hypothetical protein T06_6259 [Trichinella sp. T6]
MEKKTVLKRRAAEEMKTVPQIFYEEASSASADLETASHFPTYKSVKTAMYRKRAQKFPKLPPTRQQLEIPPPVANDEAAALELVLQPQTVICDFETALIPALQGTFPGVNIQGCYFHFCQAVLRKVTNLGMRTSCIHEAATKKSQNVAGNGFFAAS